jgi:hypothetical protein
MHRTLELTSHFPNEWVFDENENPVAPGARELAEAIVSNLRARASSVTEVDQHEHYGWTFDVVFEGSTFSNVVNPVDEVDYLTVSMDGYRLKALLLERPRATFDRYCAVLHDALNAISEVSNLRWQPYGS